jgi:hypothetical protein
MTDNNGFLFSLIMGKKCEECKASIAREIEDARREQSKAEIKAIELASKIREQQKKIEDYESIDLEILSQAFSQKLGLDNEIGRVEKKSLTTAFKQAKEESRKVKPISF